MVGEPSTAKGGVALSRPAAVSSLSILVLALTGPGCADDHEQPIGELPEVALIRRSGLACGPTSPPSMLTIAPGQYGATFEGHAGPGGDNHYITAITTWWPTVLYTPATTGILFYGDASEAVSRDIAKDDTGIYLNMSIPDANAAVRFRCAVPAR